MLAADVEDFTVNGNDHQSQKVIGGDAVFQAMRAAGIHVDVAADHAGELARRIGCVKEALIRHRVGDADIGHAGLHGGATIGVVDVQDLVHPHQSDNKPHLGQRQPRHPTETSPRRRGTTRTPLAWQKRMIAATSSVVSGRATARGIWRCTADNPSRLGTA